MYSLPFSLLALAFLSLVAQVRGESYFKKPGPGADAGDFEDNPSYKEGTDIRFVWTTDLNNVRLVLWQEYPAPGDGTAFQQVVLSNGRGATDFTWKATMSGWLNDFEDDNDDDAAVFYMALYANNSQQFDTTCHYFNVTRAERASTTTTSATQSATGTPDASKQPEADPTATSGAGGSEDGGGGLSCGAVAGISVGATIGGILLLGGLGFFAGRQFSRGGKKEDVMATTSYHAPPFEHYKPEGPPGPGELSPQTYTTTTSQTYNPSTQYSPTPQGYTPQAYHEAP